MPVTISYDLTNINGNQRNYIRSMFERFGWERLGGSVLRYPSRHADNGAQEDWLNDIIPSLMFFRSYIKKNNIQISRFTIDAMSCSFFEQDDIEYMLDLGLKEPNAMATDTPSNAQSSVQAIREFLVGSINAAP